MNTDILEKVFSSRDEAIAFAGSDVIEIPEREIDILSIDLSATTESFTGPCYFRVARLKEFRRGGSISSSHWRYCLEPER